MPILTLEEEQAKTDAAGMQCDFCSDRNVCWRFKAERFIVSQFGLASSPYWAACNTCKELIEQDRQKDLLDRSLLRLCNVETDADKTFMREALDLLYHGFFALRQGSAEMMQRGGVQ